MPTTGAPGNIWYPDDTAPVAPLENLFLTLATSVNVALAAYDASLNKVIVAASPAALDAVTTSKVGDLAWMTTPGTGIDPMLWVAYSGSAGGLDWHPISEIIASSKVNLDNFITVIAGIADLRFQVANTAIVTAGRARYRFTSTAGAYVPIIPHAEWTATSASNASGTTSSVGTLNDVTAKTNDTAFATNATNVITITEEGIYALDAAVSLPINPTGAAYVQAVVSGLTPGAFKANATTVSGSFGGSLFANLLLPAGATITLSYFHTSSGAQVLTSLYALTRVA